MRSAGDCSLHGQAVNQELPSGDPYKTGPSSTSTSAALCNSTLGHIFVDYVFLTVLFNDALSMQDYIPSVMSE